MATSPIYSWPEPDNTDLVKNGALAIRTMGNAIDTTMGTMTPKSTYTAKGSIAAATAASTPANLAVGNNGETLVADSSTSTGLRYQSAYNGNYAINGGQDIWQRGTSFAASAIANIYTADRFQFLRGSSATGATLSRQAGTTGLAYAARVQRDSGNTGTTIIYYGTSFDTETSVPLAGQTISFSFYARAGSNFSSASSALGFNVAQATSTSGNIFAGTFTGQTTVVSSTATLTTSWQRFTYTGSVSSASTQLGFFFNYTPSGTAGANDWYEVTGIQLELGSVATTFKRAGGTIQGELSACQRYYYRQTSSNFVYQYFAYGHSRNTATDFLTLLQAPVTMRVVPTSLDYSTLLVSDGASSYAVTALTLGSDCNTTSLKCQGTVASGLTTYRPYDLVANNSTTAYMGFSAEL